ncbi:MAG: peptidoglycan DD-metalloendopeptidase family protein [Caldilineaceae bacterium]
MHPVAAQDTTTVPPATTPVTYTVVSGDSLFAIAGRFGTSVEALSVANNIADPSLLQVGQVLIIPDAAGNLPSAAIATALIYAHPGDTLASLATRYNQSVDLLASINPLTTTSRLFPGQPIAIAQESAPPNPLYFGAVTAVSFPDSIIQGHTGRLLVTTSRPLTLSASFGDLQLPIQSFSTDQLRHFSYLPVDSLLDPGDYPLTIGYVTADGVPVSHTWPVAVTDGGYFFQEITVPPEKVGLLDPDVVQSELQKLGQIWAPVTPQLYWTSTFSRPIGPEYETTSPFGTRRDYNGGLLKTIHAGQDYGAPVGIPILAPGNGVVVLAEPLQVRGNAVVIDHGGGVYSGYWHMSELRVTPGQQVNTGDVLGLVGNTGLSTGAHLHWELHIYGVAVDPMQFVTEALLQ